MSKQTSIGQTEVLCLVLLHPLSLTVFQIELKYTAKGQRVEKERTNHSLVTGASRLTKHNKQSKQTDLRQTLGRETEKACQWLEGELGRWLATPLIVNHIKDTETLLQAERATE